MATPLRLRPGIQPVMHPAPNPRIAHLREQVRRIEQEPGVYRWFNHDGEIIYVGKAKNLRQRLRSYVAPKPRVEHVRKRALLENMANLDVTYTSTEMEALILEMHLIRSLKPRYNVSLTRDTHYVYVRCGLQELFPSIRLVHHKILDGAQYIGPYTNPWMQQKILELLRDIYKFRTCSMSITLRASTLFEEPTPVQLPLDLSCTQKDRRTPCLDYHIERCSAPCAGGILPNAYRRDCIDDVLSFYRGNTRPAIERMRERMHNAVEQRMFERAATLRDMIAYLEQMTLQKRVYNPNAQAVDVFGISSACAHGSILQMRGGNLVYEEHIPVSSSEENTSMLLSELLPQYYEDATDFPDVLVVPTQPQDMPLLLDWLTTKAQKPIRCTVPKKGKHKRLLSLALTNARRKEALLGREYAEVYDTSNAAAIPA